MVNAEQVITLLQNATDHLNDPDVAAAYRALMGQLSAQLVGEPLDDDLTEAEWVLLQYSLRQFAASPRGAAAWSAMRRQAEVLDSALKHAETARAAAPQAMAAPARKGKWGNLRASWFGGLSRQRTTHNTIVEQSFGDIRNSQNITITGVVVDGPVAPSYAASEETTPDSVIASVPGSEIFISYSRRDAQIMRRVRADLIAQGFTVWTDENLPPGTPSWLDTVESSICSAMCVIVLLTPDAKKSDWVEKELSTAKIHKKQIVPLLARGSEENALPLLLSNSHYLDIRQESDYKKRVNDLSKMLRTLQRGAVAAV